MILRQVALPKRFSVYAVCLLPDGGCQVERFMQEIQHQYPYSIKVIDTTLRHRVPTSGPPFSEPSLAKRLRGDACEFKGREKKATRRAPRVAFFEDGQIIVCTNAFLKDTPG